MSFVWLFQVVSALMFERLPRHVTVLGLAVRDDDCILFPPKMDLSFLPPLQGDNLPGAEAMVSAGLIIQRCTCTARQRVLASL